MCPKLLMPTYVAAIVHTNVKNRELTPQSGCDIVRDVRDRYVAGRCPRYSVYKALEFELDNLGINDGRKEYGKNVLFRDRRGCFENKMSRSESFTVDIPSTMLERGSLSYTRHPIRAWQGRGQKNILRQRPGHLLQGFYSLHDM
jgi:hypothetical protein